MQFAGHSIGLGVAKLIPMWSSAGLTYGVSPAAAALSLACGINVAVTRTVLATPIVLASLSGRIDVFPTLLVASLVATYAPISSILPVAPRHHPPSPLYCPWPPAITRHLLSTARGHPPPLPQPIAPLLVSLSALPLTCHVSSVSYISGDESIIKAARKRWLRSELDGTEALTDRTPQMERRRSRVRTPNSTPGNSMHGGNAFATAFPPGLTTDAGAKKSMV